MTDRGNFNMIKYETKVFEVDNNDVLWEKFMCFIRKVRYTDFSSKRSVTFSVTQSVTLWVTERIILSFGAVGSVFTHQVVPR